LPLRGSIELVESCIVLMACASLVGTTLERGHASVHLLTERLPPRARRGFAIAANLAGALFFTCLLLGSVLVLVDLWHGAEQTELLGIPIAPLRSLWCATAGAIALTFIAQARAA
jgi:TRAP-type C4-dicarboxylate transport system permease small subunit